MQLQGLDCAAQNLIKPSRVCGRHICLLYGWRENPVGASWPLSGDRFGARIQLLYTRVLTWNLRSLAIRLEGCMRDQHDLLQIVFVVLGGAF